MRGSFSREIAFLPILLWIVWLDIRWSLCVKNKYLIRHSRRRSDRTNLRHQVYHCRADWRESSFRPYRFPIRFTISTLTRSSGASFFWESKSGIGFSSLRIRSCETWHFPHYGSELTFEQITHETSLDNTDLSRKTLVLDEYGTHPLVLVILLFRQRLSSTSVFIASRSPDSLQLMLIFAAHLW